MDDKARQIYERAKCLLEQGRDRASIEQQEWLSDHLKEARFQNLMQKTSPNNGIIYKERQDAMVLPPDQQEALEEACLTPAQVEAIGEALAVIRRECREYAEYKNQKLMREVGELRAELQLAMNVQRLLKEELLAKKDDDEQ